MTATYPPETTDTPGRGNADREALLAAVEADPVTVSMLVPSPETAAPAPPLPVP